MSKSHRDSSKPNHHAVQYEESRLVAHARVAPSPGHLVKTIFASDQDSDVRKCHCVVENENSMSVLVVLSVSSVGLDNIGLLV